MTSSEFNALAEQLRQGDNQAAAAIFDHIAPQAYRFFLSRTGHRETAEDLSQDVFLKVVGRIQSFDRAQGDFLPWFWRIARNSLIDYFRQKKPSHLEDLERAGENIIDPHDNIVTNAKVREVMNIVGNLSDEEQELFDLHYLTDLSYTDLAQITGKTEANLRVIIHRIKQKIIKHHDE